MPHKDLEARQEYNRQYQHTPERKAYRQSDRYRAYQAAYREANRERRRAHDVEYSRKYREKQKAEADYPLHILDAAYAALERALIQRRAWKRRQAS